MNAKYSARNQPETQAIPYSNATWGPAEVNRIHPLEVTLVKSRVLAIPTIHRRNT